MWEIVVILGILVAILAYSLLVLEVEAHIPFVVVIALTSLMAVRLGHTWQELEESIIKSLGSVMQAIIILIMVGMVIGAWIQGGIVPSLIYYGLEMINPRIFLVTIFWCAVCVRWLLVLPGPLWELWALRPWASARAWGFPLPSPPVS